MNRFAYLYPKPEQRGLGFDLSNPGDLDFEALSPEEISTILQAVWAGEAVDEELAVFATTHNPKVWKWTPGPGHWCSKNKD